MCASKLLNITVCKAEVDIFINSPSGLSQHLDVLFFYTRGVTNDSTGIAHWGWSEFHFVFLTTSRPPPPADDYAYIFMTIRVCPPVFIHSVNFPSPPQLTGVNDKMAEYTSTPGASSLNAALMHTLQRHRDILQVCSCLCLSCSCLGFLSKHLRLHNIYTKKGQN